MCWTKSSRFALTPDEDCCRFSALPVQLRDEEPRGLLASWILRGLLNFSSLASSHRLEHESPAISTVCCRRGRSTDCMMPGAGWMVVRTSPWGMWLLFKVLNDPQLLRGLYWIICRRKLWRYSRSIDRLHWRRIWSQRITLGWTEGDIVVPVYEL